MSTRTELANRALFSFGNTQALLDVDADKGVEGETMRLYFDHAWDSLLQSYDWNFAAARALLPEFGQKPLYGSARQFALPQDCLKVRNLPDAHQDDKWTIETFDNIDQTDSTLVLLCELEAPLKVEFTRRIKQTDIVPPKFEDAFVAYLALKTVFPITKDRALREDAKQLYDMEVREARNRDAQEGFNFEVPQGSWVTVRR